VHVPTAVFSPEVQGVFDNVSTVTTKQVRIGAETKTISSPEDWRDQWIYFLMIDRFNNPAKPPASTQLRPPIAFDQPFGEFQGGTFEGVRQHLDYIQQLGAGAIWLSPCLKNCQYENGTYHGYGIQDFLHAEPRFASDPAAARGNPQRADDELRTLVDEVHARGMYVIFDIVLNHTGDVFGYVRDGQDNAPMPHSRNHPRMTSVGTTSTAAPASLTSTTHRTRYRLTPRSGRLSCMTTGCSGGKAK
jgi:1,4-alpha-glucan branching enzyme